MIAINAQVAAEIAHMHDVAEDYVPVSKRHQPTAEQIAVRNELADIGNLDEYDATRIVMGRLALIDQRIAAGVSAEQIAIDITMTGLNSLSLEESEFFQKQAKKNGLVLRDAVRNFYYYTDHPQLVADMQAAKEA